MIYSLDVNIIWTKYIYLCNEQGFKYIFLCNEQGFKYIYLCNEQGFKYISITFKSLDLNDIKILNH